MMTLRVALHNTALSPAERADVESRARHLERYHDRITSCRVTIEVPQRRRLTDRVAYRVRIALAVPRREIVIDRQPRRTLETALDEAFQAARRRLQDLSRRTRGDVKRHAAAQRGRITEWFPLAGYGFLETVDGERFYFDRRAVLAGAADRLEVGSAVRFAPGEGERGPQATSLAPLSSRRPVLTGR